tara:strand:+ start:119879 stop:120376 length:498 start_codon:yes stop_codon:yes gene_type:complete
VSRSKEGADDEPQNIWFKRPTPQVLNDIHQGCAIAHLGIRVTEVGDDYIAATMPVDSRTTQPYGLLHGGATVLLVETLGSAASYACIDVDKHFAVGIEVNANHISSARSGYVKGVAKPIHIGFLTHIWEVRVYHEDKLICVSRLTVSVGQRRQERKVTGLLPKNY